MCVCVCVLDYRPTADHTGIALEPTEGKFVLNDGTRNAQLRTVSLVRLASQSALVGTASPSDEYEQRTKITAL